MFKEIIVSGAIAFASLSIACVANAQSNDVRTRDLVAQLDKTKSKVKDKGNTHISVFVEIKNDAAFKTPADLAGRYVSLSTPDYGMDLNVAADGSVAAKGFDTVGIEAKRVNYTFTGRVDGALLIGLKEYADGTKTPFEGVFVIATTRSGTTDAEAVAVTSEFGLGYIMQGDQWRSRVFLQKVQ